MAWRVTSFTRGNRKEYPHTVCPSNHKRTVTHGGDGYLAVLCRRQHRRAIPGKRLDALFVRGVMELLPTCPKEEKAGLSYPRFALQPKRRKEYTKRDILVLLLYKYFIPRFPPFCGILVE